MNEVEVLKNEIASMQKQLNNAFKRINKLVAEKEDLAEQISETTKDKNLRIMSHSSLTPREWDIVHGDSE